MKSLEVPDSYQNLQENLKDKWWRLNNLYWIIDRHGKRVKFRCNTAQKYLWDNRWFLNIILKARQLGFTTFIDLNLLDDCLFYPNIESGISAHTKDDAGKIFRRKVKYPYDNLPDWIKEQRPLITDSKTELAFNNNSILSVGVSMRSGTFQNLHVSEFGKLCARFPEKAREVVAGSLETVVPGEIIYIESTAEGKYGKFYEYCKIAEDMKKAGIQLSKMDYKFFFFPWYMNPDNIVDDIDDMPIPTDMGAYFEKIETSEGTVLQPQQRFWYLKKQSILGLDMKREHPSTPDEAFEMSVMGSYFANEFTKVRKDGRICSVPAEDGVVVDTWWDLGISKNNQMAVWFSQTVGREVHLINYYEAEDESLLHFSNVIDEYGQKYGYRYRNHLAPHDIEVRELGTGKTRKTIAAEYGLNFQTIPRCTSKQDSIEAARKMLGVCWFDEEKCAVGVERLENYRRQWNESRQVYSSEPLHDANSNGADAFQTGALGQNFLYGSRRAVAHNPEDVNAQGWT